MSEDGDNDTDSMASQPQVVYDLPRGGKIVMTEIGPIQFGIPPETIKDSMVLGLGIPAFFVVPTERFVKKFGPSQGVNVAEFEFPAYCNFFFKNGKRVCLVVNDEDVKTRIQNVFQETLLGPREWDPEVDFAPDYPVHKRPDLVKELEYFRHFGDKLITVDLLLSFAIFDETSRRVKLPSEDGSTFVEILMHDEKYIVFDAEGNEIAIIDERVRIPHSPSPEAVLDAPVFKPPLFGVTVLGSSHGFDPKGSTSGYVLWMNRRGLMVDPPPNSSVLLQENNIAPSLIDAVIVTHCHADHDAGTFQKILQEGKVTLMTTPTIHGCFLRKYAALSGLDESFLTTVFSFRPVRVGADVKCRGGVLRFFYSLHSIPCVGFEAFFGGRSIVFSADHMNDPTRIQQLCEDGVLSPGRRDALLEFPWDRDLILHEAGVPPIHTPMETLSALPDDVKKRLYVVHVSLDKIPEGSGLRAAIPGVEHTISLDGVEEPPHSRALEILDLVSSIPLFSHLTVKHASDILSFCRTEEIRAGECILRKGDIGSCFYAVMSGRCEVRVVDNRKVCKERAASVRDEEEEKGNQTTRSEDAAPSKPGSTAAGAPIANPRESPRKTTTVKTYYAGDYFGEQALISENSLRTADIFAIVDVTLLKFEREDFRWMLQGTDVIQRMDHLVGMRQSGSWATIGANSLLRMLSESQKTQLETIFERRIFREGESIWNVGDPIEYACVVETGRLCCSDPTSLLPTSGPTGGPPPPQVLQASQTSPREASAAPQRQGRRDRRQSARYSFSGNNTYTRGALILETDAMLDNKPHNLKLEALETTSCLLIPRAGLLEFFKGNPGFLLSVIHTRCIT
ncbi:cGMP-dependent 3',5'-cGMP phosphodiesterase A [Hondaea fermentalgiana]|uniref:cGMP-dependent 3',5'-cGMP phosphodiesterase A n=1 Tax=Hondaea fermentalgiana TaxID=2315210 RepID=A0A2R5G3T9_9STRA|nr:cGMP-dependent 3',5'-cGMP phosphodiesterase A [Hondaea fermentalgiana]|eukprot:GBG25706.1 cGMP-dependent 3',5'-cGMP phosphodiesterase A [Hondaea fermentalgiana]